MRPESAIGPHAVSFLVATHTRASLPTSPLRTAGTLFALWLMVFTAASQTILVTPILPLIADELGVPVGGLGPLVSVYSVVLALAALVMGPVSDRIGRKRVMAIGSGVLALVLAGHSLADTYERLLVARVLAGAGGGMLSGAAVSYVGDAFPYARRGWATGWVMSGVPFGLVLGIPVGRILAVGLGFRAPFVSFAAVMAVAFVLVLTVVPQPDVERTERPTVGGALRLYRDLLRRPGPAMAALLYFVMYAGLGLLIVYMPAWLSDRFDLALAFGGRPLTLGGLPVDFIALLFFAGGLASILIGPRAGALSDRVGRRPLVLASSVGLTVLAALVPFVLAERWMAVVLYVVLMSLFAMRMAPFQALLTALVPASERGAFLSLTIAVGQIGTALGATLGGVLYGRYGFTANALASAATMALMAVLVWTHFPEAVEAETVPV
ncbi:MAG TPA: MFS transporter [Rubricoccaceae bacterium]|jgi:predicted MFS family arabinose efflux permease